MNIKIKAEMRTIQYVNNGVLRTIHLPKSQTTIIEKFLT